MLRLTELRVPLGHLPDALTAAICERLAIQPDQIIDYKIARRAHDARRKAAILMVYSVDIALKDEATIAARHSSLFSPHLIAGWCGEARKAKHHEHILGLTALIGAL